MAARSEPAQNGAKDSTQKFRHSWAWSLRVLVKEHRRGREWVTCPASLLVVGRQALLQTTRRSQLKHVSGLVFQFRDLAVATPSHPIRHDSVYGIMLTRGCVLLLTA